MWRALSAWATEHPSRVRVRSLFSARLAMFRGSPLQARVFPVPRSGLCLRRHVVRLPAAELAGELFDDRRAVALAGNFAVETAIEYRPDADPPEDTHHLHLHRPAQWVELTGRPRQNLIAAIEADQMLDLLRRSEMSPARRQIGHAGHIGKRDY